jgi:hypothetical protein
MRSLLMAISIMMFVQCTDKKAMTFEIATSQIFFDATLSNANKQLFDFYKTSKDLSYEPPQGWTIYPPLSALGQKGHSETHTFHFTTHPYLEFRFREGELIFVNRKSDDREEYGKPFIKFLFDTEEQSDTAYKMLVEEFTKLSSRKRMDSNPSTKSAEFTNDNSSLVIQVTISQGKGYNFPIPYVITFWLENDMDSNN